MYCRKLSDHVHICLRNLAATCNGGNDVIHQRANMVFAYCMMSVTKWNTSLQPLVQTVWILPPFDTEGLLLIYLDSVHRLYTATIPVNMGSIP